MFQLKCILSKVWSYLKWLVKSQDHIYKIGIFNGSAMNKPKSAEDKILDL